MVELGAELRSLVICDQIRTENTDKKIIIGVYDYGINLNVLPQIMTVWAYGVFKLLRPGPAKIEYEIIGPGRVVAGNLIATDQAPAGTCGFFVQSIVFFVEEPGEIAFRWKTEETNWSNGPSWEISVDDTEKKLPRKEADQLRRVAKYYIKN